MSELLLLGIIRHYNTVATIVIETLFPVPLPDVAQYHHFQFQLDNTGFFQSDSPVPLPDALHWCIDISGSGTGESLEMLWKKPVLSSWNWKRNLVVLGYIWKWNWKKCFNYYGRYCRSLLEEFGGHIHLDLPWAYSLLKKMKFVNRKATTSRSKVTNSDFAELKRTFLMDVRNTVEMEEIPPELILNWDQTGVKIVPTSCWTMNVSGAKRVEVTGLSDKRMITLVFCGSAVGEFLPPQIIYKGKTKCCHPKFKFPLDWHITQSPKHWSTEETMIEYINNIIVPTSLFLM